MSGKKVKTGKIQSRLILILSSSHSFFFNLQLKRLSCFQQADKNTPAPRRRAGEGSGGQNQPGTSANTKLEVLIRDPSLLRLGRTEGGTEKVPKVCERTKPLSLCAFYFPLSASRITSCFRRVN